MTALLESGEGLVAVKRLKLVVDPSKTGDTPRGDGGGQTPRRDADYEGQLPVLAARELSDFCNELLMLRAIHHPHVIGYIGCTLHADAVRAQTLPPALTWADADLSGRWVLG